MRISGRDVLRLHVQTCPGEFQNGRCGNHSGRGLFPQEVLDLNTEDTLAQRRFQLRRSLYRLGWSVCYRLSRKRICHGVSVAAFWPDDATGLDKVEAALSYIEHYAPHQHRRLCSAARVIIFGTIGGALGEWHRDIRLITLQESWVENPDTHPLHVAATIIHEYTHAWL